MGIVPTPETDRARFWAKVLKEDTERVEGLGPCWIWTAALLHNGYGAFRLDGKQRRAHVVSYEWHVGPTGGFSVLHHCDVRPCVRPEHLFKGTQKDNIQDAVSKGRMSSGLRNGMHTQGRTTLTEGQVREIYALCSEGAPQESVASQYGVGQVMISHIMTGKAWGHLGLIPVTKGGKPRPNPSTIREIRRLSGSGVPKTEIAAGVELSLAAVYRIANREVYAEVED